MIDNAVPTVYQHCPYCGHEIDHASYVNFDELKLPKPGDVSLCIKCASISIFVDSVGYLRRATVDEARKIGRDPQIKKVQSAIRSLHSTTY